jgi:hypothetical protein
MATQLKQGALTATKAPNLPLSPDVPDRRYMDDLTNTLRLYLNQNDNVNGALIGRFGGHYINNTYAAIQRTTDASFTANTATQITFDTTDFISGTGNSGTDGIAVDYSGIYNYQFSVQLKNADTNIHSAWIWLRINNVDVAGTGSKFDVTSSHGGTPGYNIAACNFFVELASGDTVEMWAAVSNANVTFDATAASTSPFNMPAIPSVVATLSFVSSLPT